MRLGEFSQQDIPKFDFAGFVGLELQPDVLSRQPNSWRRLENLDLFTPGSVRKVLGPSYVSGPFPSILLELCALRPTPQSAITSYGIGQNGNLYNLQTGALVANLSAPYAEIPFTAVLPGTSGGGSVVQYLYYTRQGTGPGKFDGTTATAVGVQAPTAGITISSIGQTATTTLGIQVQVARQYLWTYWNPTTLGESSPSPVPSSAVISAGNTWPASTTPLISQVVLAVPTGTPTPGDGYTRFRVYATRDSGATFFLVEPLYNAGGAVITDANGSAAIQGAISTVYDGFAAAGITPVPDTALVTQAPAIGANNPPPAAVWGAVYQSRLWLLDPDLCTLWFSNIGQFEQYGIDNYFRFSNLVLNDVTAIVPLSDRLICANKNSTTQITGTDFTDFVEVPVDPARGVVGRRAAASVGSSVIGLTLESMANLAFRQEGPPFFGDKIKPLTDTIDHTCWPYQCTMTLNTTLGMLFFAVRINPAVQWNDTIIVVTLGRDSPFSTITGLPSDVVTMKEVIWPDKTTRYLISCVNGNVYDLYGAPGTLVAVAETQQLPMDHLEFDKFFHSLWIQGFDIYNWQVSFSVDGNPFTPLQTLVNSNMIGYTGKEIVLQFRHAINNSVAALLSRGTLRHLPMTGAR